MTKGASNLVSERVKVLHFFIPTNGMFSIHTLTEHQMLLLLLLLSLNSARTVSSSSFDTTRMCPKPQQNSVASQTEKRKVCFHYWSIKNVNFLSHDPLTYYIHAYSTWLNQVYKSEKAFPSYNIIFPSRHSFFLLRAGSQKQVLKNLWQPTTQLTN